MLLKSVPLLEAAASRAFPSLFITQTPCQIDVAFGDVLGQIRETQRQMQTIETRKKQTEGEELERILNTEARSGGTERGVEQKKKFSNDTKKMKRRCIVLGGNANELPLG